MTKAAIYFKAESEQKDRWVGAAKADGRSLSSWIRAELDRAVEEAQAVAKFERRLAHGATRVVPERTVELDPFGASGETLDLSSVVADRASRAVEAVGEIMGAELERARRVLEAAEESVGLSRKDPFE